MSDIVNVCLEEMFSRLVVKYGLNSGDMSPQMEAGLESARIILSSLAVDFVKGNQIQN